MEQDSLSISLRCRSTGCAERASGVEASRAWPSADPRPQLEILTVFGIHEPQLAQGIQAAAYRGARDAGLLTDLRDRQQGPLRRERLNHLRPRAGRP